MAASSVIISDVRDRTSEFFATVNSFKKTLGHPSSSSSLSASSSSSSLSAQPFQFNHPSTDSHSFSDGYSSSSSNSSSSYDDNMSSSASQPLLGGERSQFAKQSQFTQAAQLISHNIMTVSEKLEKLTKLARQRSLFNDPATEINQLVSIVKTDIQSINGEIQLLSDYVEQQRQARGVGNAPPPQHSTEIVSQLKSKLATTTKSFTEVLQIRTKNLKEQNVRRKNFESGSSTSFRKRTVNPFQSLVEEDKSNGLVSDSESSSQQQLQQEQDPVLQDEYLASRAAAVESIESTIVELSTMYKQLVTLVQSQEEVTVRIDTNLDLTRENVEKGYDQLLKYFNNISSDRMLILKIFAVLLVFIVFFMIFVA